MGTVTVQSGLGPINFKIAGDKPTNAEIREINKITASPEKYMPEDMLKQRENERTGIFDNFDYTTGIQDAGLRASVSLAEEPDEEISQLAKYGLGQGDYIRDPRGKLALTPQGAAKFGIESDKNVVIDEAGFSKYDIADLAGLAPEVAGAIAGTIAGQIAIPIPIVGGVIGAALGGGGGSLLEEGYEALTGTSKQTAGEIAKDALKEAAIAGTGEAIFGLVAKGFSAVAKGARPKGLTPEQIAAYGESRELGVTPALGIIGGDPLLSRGQATGEQIFKTSPRLKKNGEAILKELQDLQSLAGTADPEELGTILMNAAQTANNSVIAAEKQAAQSVLKFMRDLADDFGRASDKDLAIDQDIYDALKLAVTTFDERATSRFSSIDAAVKDVAGNAEVIPTGAITSLAKDGLEKLKQAKLGGNVTEARDMLNDLATLGKNASFSQLYYLRKNLNDFLMGRPDKNTVRIYGEPLLQQIDNAMTADNLENILSSRLGISPEGIEKVTAASRQLNSARAFFKEGSRQLEEISNLASINAIRNELKEGRRVNPAGIMNSLVKNDNPELLRRFKTVIDTVPGVDYDVLLQRVAGEWIRKNIGKSVNDLNPRKFDGSKFRQAIDNLGSTADELFGSINANALRNLGKQMEATSLSKVDESVIRSVEDIIGSDAPDIGLLRNLALVQREVADTTRNRLISRLNSPTMDPLEAAELITMRSTTASDIERVMKYFANDGAAQQKLRGFYMENLVGDFGESFMTNQKLLKEFGARLQRDAKSGKLRAIYGDKMAERMAKFGRVLSFNSQTVDGGNLVAANIAVSPLQNLPKLLKFSILGRLFSTDLFYKNLDAQYALMKGMSPNERARALGRGIASGINSLIAQSTVQGGAEALSTAKKEAEGLMSAYDQMQQQNQQQRQARQARQAMAVPQVMPGGIDQAPIMPPQQPTIRQRAAENPAIASTLLGGLGSASLLNR